HGARAPQPRSAADVRSWSWSWAGSGSGGAAGGAEYSAEAGLGRGRPPRPPRPPRLQLTRRALSSHRDAEFGLTRRRGERGVVPRRAAFGATPSLLRP